MRIGELADLAGVSTRTIRHYHHIGLLAEPGRTNGGYRTYQLGDAVRLLRVRRLVEMGLNLEEVGDALADDEGRDLREILTEIDVDLAAAEERIRARRARIAELLARDGDLTVPAGQERVSAALAALAGDDAAGLEREQQLLELLGPLSGNASAQVYETYQVLLDNTEFTSRMQEIGMRIAALADAAVDDPEIERIAAAAASVGPFVRSLVPADAEDAFPGATSQLFGTVTADMPPAQARCVQLMLQLWQEAST